MNKEQMTICLLNDSFPPTVDGVANCVLNYARIIQRRFGEAVVLTPSYPGVVDRYDFRVIRYPSVNLTRLFGYRAGVPFNKRTIQTVSRMPVDVLHTHSPIMSGVLARILREKLQCPLVLTYHTKFDVDIRRDIKSAALQERAIQAIVANIESCNEVWTVSRGAGENLRSLGYKGDYTVMYNGVDLPRGRAPEEDVAQLNREYGLPDGVPVLLFVGRLMWYKGIRIILDGLKLMKAQGIPFRMLFVGDGGDAEEIRAYSKEQGLTDVCQFIPTLSDRQKLRAFYTRADLFLFPSDFDTNGLVVREAAACGTASLTLRDTCASEDIIHLRNGLTIEKSAEALARETAGLIGNMDAAARLGQRAMDELYISWEQSVAAAYKRYYAVLDRFWTNRTIRRGKSDAFLKAISKLYRT